MEETNLSQESLTEKVDGLEIQSSESEVQCTSIQINETITEKITMKCGSSEETSSSSSTTSEEAQNVEVEQPQKRKRKRKRKHKKKSTTTAYEPEEPFTKRYKNISLDLKIIKKPKMHIKFDDNGNIDEKLSKFNYKPRIIKALEVNMTINNTIKRTESCETVHIKSHMIEEEPIISLKPRIIKAIGT